MCIRNLKYIYPQIKYVCIGDGEERENILKLCKELKIENEVIFFYNVYGKRQIKVGDMATVIGIFENQYITKKSYNSS